MVLTAKGRPVQEQQLMRAYDTGQAIDVDTLIRISGELGLKAGCMQVDKSHLAVLPHPCWLLWRRNSINTWWCWAVVKAR